MLNKFNSHIRNNQFGLKSIEDVKKDMVTGEVGKSGLPKSNVLYFALENDTWCCARPSGTEPKLKFYMGVKGNSMQNAISQLEDLTAAVKEMAGV